jgi:hypothetical protein
VDPHLRRRTTDVPVGEESLAHRIRNLGERVGGSSLLDTIIYRRLWIPVLAASLIGIVGMQVFTLKINAGIGRTVDRSVLLERENTALAAEVSRLESSDRLSAAVAGMGLVDPAVGSTRYMRADGTVLADEAAPSGSQPTADTVAAAPAPAPAADPAVATGQAVAAPAQPQAPAAAPAPAAAAPTPTPTPAPAAAPTTAPATASPAAASGGATAGGTSAPTAAVGIR